MNLEENLTKIAVEGESNKGKLLRWKSSKHGTEFVVYDPIEHLIGAWIAVENAGIHLWAKKWDKKINEVKWDSEIQWKQGYQPQEHQHWSHSIEKIKVTATIKTDETDQDLERLRQKVSEWNVIDQMLKNAGITFDLQWKKDQTDKPFDHSHYVHHQSQSYFYSSGTSVEYTESKKAHKHIPDWAAEWKEWDVNDALEYLLGAFIGNETDAAYWWASYLGFVIHDIRWHVETPWNDKAWMEAKEGMEFKLNTIKGVVHIVGNGTPDQFTKLKGLIQESSVLYQTFKKAGVNFDIDWKWENPTSQIQF